MSQVDFSTHGLGCHLDDPTLDAFDHKYGVTLVGAEPRVTHNRDAFMPRIKDQRRSNGCVGFSGATALEQAEFRATNRKPPEYSPLFGWYNARDVEGSAGMNVGCTIRDYAEQAKRKGVCSEDRLPFAESTSDDYLVRLANRPSALAYEEAERHQVLETYVWADADVTAAYDALSRGYGFQTAFPVFASFFDTPASGIVAPWSGPLAGWHAVYIIDADVVNGVAGFWVINSWGIHFGKGGLFFISLDQYKRHQDNRVYSKLEVLG